MWAFLVHNEGVCVCVLQSTAKQQYLLTDGDLKDLGYIERKNPRKNDWHPMRLYMESQVRDVAYTKYGGQAGLEQEAREKVSKKLEMRLKVGVAWCVVPVV